MRFVPVRARAARRPRIGAMRRRSRRASLDPVVAMLGPLVALVAGAGNAGAQQTDAAAAVADAAHVAEDAGLWSLQPLPETDDRASPDRIDALVRARLLPFHLDLAPRADPRTLARRAALLLTGLPPTPEQVADQVADPSRANFARFVDELLASTACAEHLARRWLDLARYSDSNGLDENLAFGSAWRYRDWVVAAFADDMPYDRFGTLQLAGDLLPADDPTPLPDRLVATGFLALGPRMLAEQDKEKLVLDTVDEQVDLVGRTFLGLTLGCARCHDHKFDPVPTRDYYALAGIFRSTRSFENLDHVSRWVERPLATAAELQARERAVAAEKQAERALRDFDRDVERELPARLMPRIADTLLAGLAAAGTAVLREAESADRTNLRADDERWGSAGCTVLHTVNAGLQYAEYDVATGGGRHRLAVRMASDEARPLRVLIDGEERIARTLADDTGGWLPPDQRWLDAGEFELAAGDHVLRLEGLGPHMPHLDKLVLAPAGEPWPAALARERSLPAAAVRNAAFLVADSKALPARTLPGAPAVPEDEPRHPAALLALLSDPGNVDDRDAARAAWALRWQIALGTAWQSALEEEPAPPGGGDGDGQQANEPAKSKRAPPSTLTTLRRLATGPGGLFEFRGDERLQVLSSAARERRQVLALALDRARAAVPPPPPTALCVTDGDPRDLPVHLRGNHLTLADRPVPRGFLSVLGDVLPPPQITAGSGRLQLARWLFDRRNPLTARVAANRAWQLLFGEGLARDESNFGVRGQPPSHPELLDLLAVTLIGDGWSLRALLRRIALSDTWCQATRDDDRARQRDPDGRLLWSQHRRRLPAEAIRDSILQVSGQLDRTIGGSLLGVDNRAYVTNDQSNDKARYDVPRRSLYLPVIRNAMYDLFGVFDYADPSVHLEQRPESAVAPQALLLLNSPFVIAQAGHLADAAQQAATGDDARIDWIWTQALQRAPSARERDAAHRWLAFAPDAHRWPGLCQSMFALSEFVYVE